MTTDNSTQVTPIPAQAAADLPAGSAVSRAAADGSALAWLNRAGTVVLGESLAYVSTPRYGSHQLVWLVSIDPAGGLGSVGSGETDNFVVAVISAKTGQWLMAIAGKSPLLPALPAIATAGPPGITSTVRPGGPGPSVPVIWRYEQVSGHSVLVLAAVTVRYGIRWLYYNAKDTATTITCTRTCTKSWWPLLASELRLAHPSSLNLPVRGLAYVAGPDGRQAEYEGHPL